MKILHVKSIPVRIRYFLVIEGLLYITFLIGDLLDMPTGGIKYLSIILCAALAIAQTRHLRDRFVPVALLLTLGADAFLLFTDYYLVGVLWFCGVQAVYAARLMWWRGRVRRFVWQDHVQSVAWRAFLYGVSLIVLRLVSKAVGTNLMTPLNAAALRSFGQLTVSVVEAWHLCRFDPRARTFAVGMNLFWACDLCVGLRFMLLSSAGGALAGVLPLVSYGMWFFYLPAQVCIALSGVE